MSRAAATALAAPFPYFGGKRSVGALVWQRLGKVKSYLEPFAGSLAVLWANPRPANLEVVGDANHYIANFWRAVKHQPEEVARWADEPVIHVELTARHRWLTEPDRVAELRERLLDAEWPGDAQIAGWWVWGQSNWIGSGWCEARTSDKIPHVSNAGMGGSRSSLRDQIPHVSNAGMGVGKQRLASVLVETMGALAERLRHVRVINGDWSRCLNTHYGEHDGGTCGVFLDPPYKGFEKLYPGAEAVATKVAAWARKHGERKSMRIALCGHIGDYELPGWEVVQWQRKRLTYGSSKTTAGEAIWFSPGCLAADGPQGELLP